MVCWMTRGPANPMRALGSATMTCASIAKLAVTPPKVGSARMEMYGTRASARRPMAAAVLAICINERIPSCIRAPPDVVTSTSGIRSRRAPSAADTTFSPTTEPMLPPMNPKWNTPMTTWAPLIRPSPITMASFLPVLCWAAWRRSL